MPALNLLRPEALAGRAFAAGGLGGLRAAVDGTWSTVHEVAATQWLNAAADGAGGRIVLVAPRPGSGEQAGAAAAALESVVRTLAVKWARFGVRATAVAPGPRTTEEELAALVAFLASPGGEYSGCRFELR